MALAAGVIILVPKAALAAWTAMCLLRGIDQRVSTAPFALLLAGVAGLASAQVAWTADSAAVRWSSLFVLVCSGVQTLRYLRSWLSGTPSEIHQEARRIDAPPKKKNAKRKPARRLASSSTSPPSGVEWLVCLAGWLASCTSIALITTQLEIANPWSWWSNVLNSLVTPLMWGVCLICSLEVTFLSSPESLRPAEGPRVSWHWLSRIALLLLVMALLVCGVILRASSQYVETDVTQSLLMRVFAISLMIVHFLAWIIPHRVAGFQKAGEPRGWASLALSGWLAFLALGVVCGLPPTWPWKPL